MWSLKKYAEAQLWSTLSTSHLLVGVSNEGKVRERNVTGELSLVGLTSFAPANSERDMYISRPNI